MATEVCEM